MAAKWKDRPFAIVGVNSDKLGLDALAGKLKDEGISWRNFIDGSTSGPIDQAWKIHAWPTMYLLDAKGVIQYRGRDWEKIAEDLMGGAGRGTPTRPGE